jgi:vacuolar-type H+-ATPase subunit E/Vma4
LSEEDKAQANPLVARILADAREEAARLVAEAEGTAAKRREAAAEELRGLERKADERIAERLEALRRNTASRVNVETRRARLRVRDRIVVEAEDAVRASLAAMIGTSEYRAMLIGWIAEAAVGLGQPEAEVNASAAERKVIDAALLAEAEREVMQSVGREVRLTPSEAQPLIGQGVVLTSRSGRIAYNNQVATRLLREQTRIRSLIHKALFVSE